MNVYFACFFTAILIFWSVSSRARLYYHSIIFSVNRYIKVTEIKIPLCIVVTIKRL